MLTVIQAITATGISIKRLTSATILFKKLTGVSLTRREMGLIKTMTTFAIGVYVGVYATQNYEVPKVGDPKEIAAEVMTKINEYLEANKKEK